MNITRTSLSSDSSNSLRKTAEHKSNNKPSNESKPNREPHWVDQWTVGDKTYQSSDDLVRGQTALLGKSATLTYREDPKPQPYTSAERLLVTAGAAAKNAVYGAGFGLLFAAPISCSNAASSITGGMITSAGSNDVAGYLLLGSMLLGAAYGVCQGLVAEPEQVKASVAGNFIEQDGELGFVAKDSATSFKLKDYQSNPMDLRRDFEHSRTGRYVHYE